MLVLLAHPPGPRSGPFADSEPGMCVSDLRHRIGRAHALVSHHVQVLLRAGLIRRVRRGRWSLLQLDTCRVAALGDQIAALASDQLRGPASVIAQEALHPRPSPSALRLGPNVAPTLTSSAAVPPSAPSGPGATGAPTW